ncbi:MAG TPA: glycerol-3-phosphate 1-O-acyltransferase PlsY [Nevskiaceae bacterium]|nr:glycerol-3-phosphate 1-O-acyltransferase PlsY [Nevskiaceae bacterium]
MLELIIKFLGAYLLGNLLGGEVVGALSGGVNLRSVGSGNIGATNALRTQGKGFALAVLAIDIFKGVAAVTFIPAIDWHWVARLYWNPVWQEYLCGVAVTLGHCYPLRHRFAGGKGVATLAGVYGALLPWSLPWLLGSFVLVILLTGYASLATLTASVMAMFFVACISHDGMFSPAGTFTIVMALLVAWKHRDNIRRLLRGEESRFERARVLGRRIEQWLSR